MVAGEKIIDWKSSKENISNRNERVKAQVEMELSSLKDENDLSSLKDTVKFYEQDENDPNVIKYNVDGVKSYLWKLSKSLEGKQGKEAWKYLNEWGSRQYAWIMAVQIALETQEYDVGVIDGLLWGPGSHTRRAVWSFQEKWNENHKDEKDKLLVVDWLPGKATINALLEAMGWAVEDWDDNHDKDPEKTDEEKIEKVKLKEGYEVEQWSEIKVEDLVEANPDEVDVKFKEDQDLSTDEPGYKKVILVLTSWEKTKEREVKINVVEKEKTDKEKIDSVKFYEGKKVAKWSEIKVEDLVEANPDNVDVSIKNPEEIKTDEVKDIEVVVILKSWDVTEEKPVKLSVVEQKEIDEEKIEKVKLKEGYEVEQWSEIKVEDLVEANPDNVDVKFKEDQDLSTDEPGEKKVVLVLTSWEKTEERKVTINVVEEKEKETEEFDTDKIQILDLWEWENSNFKFKDWLIDEDTGNLTIDDKVFPKLNEWDSGFWYILREWDLCIWNFKDGVLNWKWVEFYKYFEDESENRWEFVDGYLNAWIQTVKEWDLKMHYEVKDGILVRCYTYDHVISINIEKDWESTYLKYWDDKLKLKNVYYAQKVVKTLWDYGNKQWEFTWDFREPNKLFRVGTDGKKEEVYSMADSIVDTTGGIIDLWAWSVLAWWLNNVKEFKVQQEINEAREILKEIDINTLWTFDEDGIFHFNDWVEKEEDGGTYIEIWWRRFYEDNSDWFFYSIGDNLYFGFAKDWDREWYWVTYWQYEFAGVREEWERKEGKREWFWEITTPDWKKWWWEYKEGKQEWLHVKYYANWNKKFEWGYKEGNEEWPWVYYHENWNKSSEWEYKEGESEWNWVTYYENWNKRFEINWKWGKKDWDYIEYYENWNKKFEWKYEEGKQEWFWVEYHENWNKRSEWKYEAGEKEWPWVGHHPNWNKRYEWGYKEGKEEWLWVLYYLDWNKKSETNWKWGKKDWDYIEYYENWNKKFEWGYKEGKEEWPWVTYYENWEEKEELNYKNGRQEGYWKRINSDWTIEEWYIEYDENWCKWEWNYDRKGRKEWYWTITTPDWKQWWGNFKKGKKDWHWVEYDGDWYKLEWEYKKDKKKWQWTKTDADWNVIE